MKLYHGTNVDFEKIDFSKSRKNKDFGQGFYLTTNRSHAERIAMQRSLIDGGSPVVQVYEFDEKTALSETKVLTFKEYSKEWALFINKNRNTKHTTKMHDYDIVYGPIADDKVGLQVKLFNQELIGIETLLERLKYITPTFQFYFGTEKSLQYLKRL